MRAGANFIHTIGTSIRQKLLEDIEKYTCLTLLMDGSTLILQAFERLKLTNWKKNFSH